MRGRAGLIAPLLVAGATVWAFAPGLEGAFLWDDGRSIVENPHVRHLGWTTLTRTSRPLVQLSFALNHAQAGLDPWPYHLLNLAFHLLTALALCALVRRVLARAGLSRGAAAWLAGAVAAVWAVHPLQTESVTYIVQRSEVLAALFGVLVLHGLDRAASAPRPGGWTAAAIAASVAAMASKPIAVAFPVVALLYDRAFLAGSFGEAWRRRRLLHGGLAVSIALVPAFLAAGPGDWTESSGGSGTGFRPAGYALTQIGVVAHYLRLVVWPHPLVLDYGWPAARGPGDGWPATLVVVSLLALTAWGLARNRVVGFLGAAFFVLLAPTSSLYPVADAAFEHRMYLPLAAVLTALGLGAARLRPGPAGRLVSALVAVVLTLALVIALGLATRARNRDYRSAVAMWSLNAAQRPEHPRPRVQLGTALAESGRLAEAIREYTAVLERHPGEATALANLGVARERQGAVDEAMERYAEALRIDPRLRGARNNLGVLLARKGRLREAIVELDEAVRRHPDFVEGRYNLALALRLAGRRDEARSQLRGVLALDPGHALARRSLQRLDAAGP